MGRISKILILLVLLVAYICSMPLIFIWDDVVYVENKGSRALFFSGEFFQYHVLLKKQKGILNSLKILDITKEDVYIFGFLNNMEDKYLVLGNRNCLTMYSMEDRPVAQYSPGDNGYIINGCISDLNGDRRDEVLLVTGKRGGQYGDSLVILSFYNGFEEVFRKDLTGLNPWKVMAADVDGDGSREISLGVYKTAKFHPVMAKRPFIYNWKGDAITPKWEGSRLSRPFEDYIFADIDSDGRDELLSIEVLANGQKVINSYKWKGFGFEGIGEGPVFNDICGIRKGCSIPGGWTIYARVMEGDNYRWAVMCYNNGKLLVQKKQGECPARQGRD